jgi:carboxypeptidase T
MTKLLCFCLLIFGAAFAQAETAPIPAAPVKIFKENRVWVVVKAPRARRAEAAELGLSIEEVRPDSVAGVATLEAVARLEAKGFVIVSRMSLAKAFALDFPQADKAYHDYRRVQDELAAIVKAHPGLASLVEVGRSYKGLSITAIRFNTTAQGAAPSAKPGALFLGSHHAREHLSTEVPVLLARWLADNKAKPEVRKLLETRDILIAPLVNPDGSEFDIVDGQYRWQRKNMRPNGDGTLGTDLNRNYDSHWGESGSSRHPGDDTYQGPGPFSEPESKAVRDFILARPNIKTMVSYHTYSELILYPWSYTEDSLPDGPALKAYQAMAAKMAGWTGYEAMQSGAFYPSSGDTCDWAWEARGIFCFTFELTPKSGSGGGFYPGPAVIGPTVEKNVAPLLYLTGLADDPLRAGR